ncbi:DUF4269 domain-containing protein [Pedobacter petrophilus]|uniref:DUF4269 domain-containing protein n=2 Tax=Pedobacter TaxID=84567 RepID=A0A7K0G760_9SPHI|nr:DUF4269 domain-containing protein [Pedobacter petrophilus]MRX78806.1 DUF4269 domain-containing protein [Pedobacter petrophilus]
MHPVKNFDSIAYLKYGNDRQISVYDMLKKQLILEMISEFDPIVVGTIPIDIDIESSDIDIICYSSNKEYLSNVLTNLFQYEDGFKIWEYNKTNPSAIVAKFKVADFEIEIFGQDVPTRRQVAYRHMMIEYQILLEKGEAFRKQIIELKRQGMKTEPAFATLLGLQGNPYEELLKYEKAWA